jgi:hypothetical protein
MGCCGKSRNNLSVMRAAKVPAATPGSGAAPRFSSNIISINGAAPLQLRYLGPSDVVVRGPLTGKSYTFTQTQPVHTVDRRDAVMLLRTRHFRQHAG